MARVVEIEKWVWTDEDFDRISFHDVRVVAMAGRANDASGWNFSFLLDIDWIVEWLCDQVTRRCEFAVTPATMVFENVSDVRFSGKSMPGSILDLDRITRRENEKILGASLSTWSWHLVGHDGEVELNASGFKLFARKPPVIIASQQLDLATRGGISFDERRVE
jgi:hypothetical protein